jgi:hypothetical protein
MFSKSARQLNSTYHKRRKEFERYPPEYMGVWRSHTPIYSGGYFSIITFETAPFWRIRLEKRVRRKADCSTFDITAYVGYTPGLLRQHAIVYVEHHLR